MRNLCSFLRRDYCTVSVIKINAFKKCKCAHLSCLFQSVSLNEFTIDISAPVFLDESSVVEHRTNTNSNKTSVNNIVKNEPLDEVFTNPPPLVQNFHSTTQKSLLKTEETRNSENVLLIPVQQSAQNLLFQQSQPTLKSPVRTPKKVGRPRNSAKKSQPSSPYSSKTKKSVLPLLSNSPSTMSPMMPPPHVQAFHQQRFV